MHLNRHSNVLPLYYLKFYWMWNCSRIIIMLHDVYPVGQIHCLKMKMLC